MLHFLQSYTEPDIIHLWAAFLVAQIFNCLLPRVLQWFMQRDISWYCNSYRVRMQVPWVQPTDGNYSNGAGCPHTPCVLVRVFVCVCVCCPVVSGWLLVCLVALLYFLTVLQCRLEFDVFSVFFRKMLICLEKWSALGLAWHRGKAMLFCSHSPLLAHFGLCRMTIQLCMSPCCSFTFCYCDHLDSSAPENGALDW